MDDNSPTRCALVVGGKYHDMDFARLEILKYLAEDEKIRTKVYNDYDDISAILSADFIVTYTCDVMPSPPHQRALREWLVGGGRWLALHGTNSVLKFTEEGRVAAPDTDPYFMEILGTSFAAHPPIEAYQVHPTEAGRRHPLTADIDAFETIDELYLSRTRAEIDTLLAARFCGKTERFVDDDWPEADYPVLYIRQLERGAVLYLTLGHCRGHYDLRPIVDYYPVVERGSWHLPVYGTLVRRGIEWAKAGKPSSAGI